MSPSPNRSRALAALVKNNPGKLQIHGVSPANNFSGGTIINSGTLHLGAIIDGVSPAVTNPLGSGPVTLNNGTIEFDRVTASNPLTVNGGTLFSNNGWGSSWSGPITLNGTATVNCSYRFTISGTISGAGGLTKTGDDSLILSVANSYTGTDRGHRRHADLFQRLRPRHRRASHHQSGQGRT